MAYTYTAYAGGTQRSDGVFFPSDPRNRDYQLWLAFTTAGGITNAGAIELVADARLRGARSVDALAARERSKHFSDGIGLDYVEQQRFAEAVAIENDGTPTNGEYPLLAAEIGITANDLVNVGAAVRTERATLLASLAAIETVRRTKRAAVAAAATPAAVDTILAAITWP